MPALYEALKAKALAKREPLKEAKTEGARIYNSIRKKAAARGKSMPKLSNKHHDRD